MSPPGLPDDSYTLVLQRLFSSRRAGIDFGLERIRQCLDALELLHKPHALVQVAGTNGKGSTSAFLAEILQRAGFRVGVFSSPHLVTIRERFRINREMVSRKAVLEAYQAVEGAHQTLTFFEAITAMAAWIFDRERVDVAIYEVGLGGRLDSTTALPATLSIVTGIGIDHTEFLGDTIEEIASEKAGIFRHDVPAIIGLSAPPAIRDQLAAAAGHPIRVSRSDVAQVPRDLLLHGDHQRRNAACALVAARALRDDLGLAIAEKDILDGLATTALMGRLTELEPGVLLDGAHNEQAARALATALADRPPMALVVGMSGMKDIGAFLEPLRTRARVLIATEWDSERAQPAEAIAAQARRLGFEAVEVAESPAAAIVRAKELSTNVLITGSLLLLGEVLSAANIEEADPIVLTDPAGRLQK